VERPGEIAELKARLRAELLARRERIARAVRERASSAVCRELVRLGFGEGLVMAYWPIRGEVDPLPWVRRLWRQGLEVAFPVVEKGKGLIARRTRSPQDFVRGAFGIMEPASTCPAVAPEEIHTVLVPAVAYDTRGFRLGYGGGYYDRFLPTLLPSAELVGLTYEELLVEQLPVDRHDHPVRWIVTERRCLGPLTKDG